jgi:hypothetical protein
MNRLPHIDGTAARQLDLIDEAPAPAPRARIRRPEASLRVLRKDVYAELAKRRRRAQIAARHALEHQ